MLRAAEKVGKSKALVQDPVDGKKSNKLRIARADHPFRVYEAVHVNRDPAAVHEDE